MECRLLRSLHAELFEGGEFRYVDHLILPAILTTPARPAIGRDTDVANGGRFLKTPGSTCWIAEDDQIGHRRCDMHKTMAATALSFFLAMGGGVALANSSSGHQSSSSAGTTSSQTSGSKGSEPQGTQANPANAPAPVGFAEEEVTSAPFTVQSVDKKNHSVVLRAPDGTQSTVSIPSGTPGFDSLNKGDKVQLDYFAAAVFGPGDQQGNRANQNGSTQGSASDQASGAANNHIGRVSNIRKVNDNNGKTSNSGNTQGTGSQRSGSGMEHGSH